MNDQPLEEIPDGVFKFSFTCQYERLGHVHESSVTMIEMGRVVRAARDEGDTRYQDEICHKVHTALIRFWKSEKTIPYPGDEVNWAQITKISWSSREVSAPEPTLFENGETNAGN